VGCCGVLKWCDKKEQQSKKNNKTKGKNKVDLSNEEEGE